MRPYRCYFLDTHGLIKDTKVLVCAGDSEVEAMATGLLAARPQHSSVEIWNRYRRVGLRTAQPQHA